MKLPFYTVVVTYPDMENEIVFDGDGAFQAQTEEEAKRKKAELTEHYSTKCSCSYKVVRVE